MNRKPLPNRGVPNAGAASIAKGFIDVPQGIGNKILNRVAPNSEAANISNRFSEDLNNTYTQNFTPSALGEAMGNALPFLGLPVIGKGLGGAVGTGAYTGAIQSQGRTTDADGWTPQTSQEVNDQSVNNLAWGAGFGAATPLATDLAGKAGRKLSPYMVDIKDYLKEKVKGLNGVEPFRAFIDDMLKKRRACRRRKATAGTMRSVPTTEPRKYPPSRLFSNLMSSLPN